ncbi:MAG TPA: hypothetical protein VJY62_11370, partial [Bacteroidia bacterium]|nr:hypothetical protein [Bacteroidia bacterium]
SQEINVLASVRQVKQLQIDESNESLAALEVSLEMARKKIEYYSQLPRMNDWEITGVTLHNTAITFQIISTVMTQLGGILHLVPRTDAGGAGTGGSAVFKLGYGGDNLGPSIRSFGEMFQALSGILSTKAGLADAQGSYTRRHEESQFQKQLGEIESAQIEKQIIGAGIRIAIAEKELENHDLQIENAKATEEYFKSKYTNRQLYDWMLTQVSTVYFQAYQLAYDMAKKAEKCYQFELGIQNTNFIQFGYWDSLKKGLLAGDKLAHDIHRMDAAFMENNVREFEITKHISLAQLFPQALLELKTTGTLIDPIVLEEWMFDMDYPGHYMRRIKTVSVSIPCIAGPYTSINCRLELVGQNYIRVSESTGYPMNYTEEGIITQASVVNSIATSHAQTDSGMFELNFNDERYLPFEGAGAVSTWNIFLNKENNFFDFATISDVILHVKYTSRYSFALEVDSRVDLLTAKLPTKGARLFSVKHDFSSEWHKFLSPQPGDQELILNLKSEHYPFFTRNRDQFIINKISIIIEGRAGLEETDYECDVISDGNSPSACSGTIPYNTTDTHFASADFILLTGPTPAIAPWSFKIKKSGDPDWDSLLPDDLKNVYLILSFQYQAPTL